MSSLRKAGHTVDAIGCARALAQIRIAQGRLREAARTYEHGLQLATEHGASVLRGAADMHVGLADLFLEWDDLETANHHLSVSQELGEDAGLAQNPYRQRVAMARLREAQGDIGSALDLLDEAEGVYVSAYYPDVRPVAALKARMWALQGRGEAVAWAHGRGLSPDDELSYLREFEHITLARVLIGTSDEGDAEGSIAAAVGLLRRLLAAAEEGQRTGSVVEILLMEALAHQRLGDVSPRSYRSSGPLSSRNPSTTCVSWSTRGPQWPPCSHPRPGTAWRPTTSVDSCKRSA